MYHYASRCTCHRVFVFIPVTRGLFITVLKECENIFCCLYANVHSELVLVFSRWETLKSLSADKQLKLSTALERARGFHLSWRQLQDQLSQFEEKTTSSPLPHGRPVPCQADLDKHQAFEVDVQGLKEVITAFRSEGEGLKSQCAAEDQEMVNRWISEVEQRWDDILAAVRERQVNGQLNASFYTPKP